MTNLLKQISLPVAFVGFVFGIAGQAHGGDPASILQAATSIGRSVPSIDDGQRMAERAVETVVYGRALAALDARLSANPDDFPALIGRGHLQGRLGRTESALADLDKAVALAPGNSYARVVRGVALSAKGEVVRAAADYLVALQIAPTNVPALVNHAALAAAGGQALEALNDLDIAIALQPDYALAHYNRGYVRFTTGAYEKAIEDYSTAIRLEPDLALAYNNRCLTRVVAGRDLAGALLDCDEALRRLPESGDVRDTRGFVFLKLGEPERALREYARSIELGSHNARALYGRGLACLMLGDLAGAATDFAAARRLNPSVDLQFAVYGLSAGS